MMADEPIWFELEEEPRDLSLAIPQGAAIESQILPAPEIVTVLEVGQGPAGPPGEPSYLRIIAPFAMSAHRALARCAIHGGVEYADFADIGQAGLVLGISRNAALEGDTVEICFAGQLSEPGWNWEPGFVFIGQNGQLTQTPPVSGFVQSIGMAIAPSSIYVRFLEPIIL